MPKEETTRKIYEAIGDETSKRIFTSRMLYSLTGDRPRIGWMGIEWIKSDLKRDVESDRRWIALKNRILEMKEKPYIFGAGVYGKQLFEKTGGEKTWRGFIDNARGGYICGVPVMTPEKAAADTKGRNIVISSRKFFGEMRRQLLDLGIEKQFIMDGAAVFDAIEGRQYFDLPCLEYGEKEVFIDGGCYDGMMSIIFSGACLESYEKIYCFEPDARMLHKIQKNFAAAGLERYELIDMALWNACEELSFVERADSGSHIAECGKSGTCKVKGISLDDVLDGTRASFIKLDVEGAERNALIGAEHTIVTYKPKLAVGVYHKPEDIWELPELILEMRPDYRIYFRHYSPEDWDTVLYAI